MSRTVTSGSAMCLLSAGAYAVAGYTLGPGGMVAFALPVILLLEGAWAFRRRRDVEQQEGGAGS